MLDSILNPVLGPLLTLSPLWAIIIVSLILSVLITLVYKWMTDQTMMKALKADMKSLQKQMKEVKDDTKKVMALQKEAMQKNMKYMIASMKPTLVTFLPLILIFGWLNAHMAYDPIIAEQEFDVTAYFTEGITGSAVLTTPNGVDLVSDSSQSVENGMAMWKLKGSASQVAYPLTVKFQEREYMTEVLITDGSRDYVDPVNAVNDEFVEEIKVSNKPVKPLNIFGWRIGWLGTYIIFSIIFSMLLRKAMKLA